ncbi:hypothetical protein GW950_01330 [Candidatus Wolfebacteria bacterium]|nr:hypothetical protein [Candidatus Wolfebacteria bacterium]
MTTAEYYKKDNMVIWSWTSEEPTLDDIVKAATKEFPGINKKNLVIGEDRLGRVTLSKKK